MSKQHNDPAGVDDLPLSGDILWGAKRLAEFLGKSERQANYLIERKLVPFGYIGGQVVSSKSALRRHFAALSGGDA